MKTISPFRATVLLISICVSCVPALLFSYDTKAENTPMVTEMPKHATNGTMVSGHLEIDAIEAGILSHSERDNLYSRSILKNDVASVRKLLAHGSKPEEHWLIEAAKLGNTEIVRALLDAGARVDVEDRSSCTALVYAAQGGYAELASLLLSKGADPNARKGLLRANNQPFNFRSPSYYKDSRVSALMYAAQGGYTQIVEALLARGANVNAQAYYEETALMYAAAQGHTDTVLALLRHGADIHVYANNEAMKIQSGAFGDSYGGTAFLYALRGKHAAAAQAIMAEYLRRKEPIDDADSVFSSALYAGDLGLVRTLAAQGIDTRKPYLLPGAARNASVEIFKFLLDKMPDEEFRNGRLNPAVLTAAADSGVLAKVKLMVERGANTNARDGRGQNALYYAVYQDAADVVGYLLDKGIEVNVSGSSLGISGMGDTPLALAVQKGNVGIIKQLLAKGADANFKEQGRKSAMDVATELGRTDILLTFANAGTHAADALPESLRGRTTYRSPATADDYVLYRSGEKLYAANCASCHKTDGTGNDKNMSLRQELLKGKSKQSLIAAILQGVKAPNYIPMEENQSSLQDAEVAAILVYVNKAWGNNLGLTFQPQDVRAARNAAPTRTQDALMKNDKGAIDAIRKLNKMGYLYSESMFVEAVRTDDRKALDLFLAAGMNPAAKNAKGETALFVAASTDNGDAAKVLLDHGADIRQKNAPWSSGYSAIWAASMDCYNKSKTRALQTMLDHGLDINLRESDRTLLMQAAFSNCAETAQFLIKRGADVNARMSNGKSVLTLAKMYGHDVVPVLLGAGAHE